MKTTLKIIHWTPRIFCILVILFISMFALDSFDPKFTLWQQLVALFMNLIPTWILIIFLVIAWKWELAGGIFLAIVALGFTPFIYFHNYTMNQSVWISLSIVMMINFPVLLTGMLFVLSHYLKKKNQGAIEPSPA
jgi:hypothetical protein